MPIRYEDWKVSDLRKLARSKSIRGVAKSRLISKLRRGRIVSKLKSTRRSPQRVKKFESCVRQVKSKGSGVNPYAVCHASIYKTNNRRRSLSRSRLRRSQSLNKSLNKIRNSRSRSSLRRNLNRLKSKRRG